MVEIVLFQDGSQSGYFPSVREGVFGQVEADTFSLPNPRPPEPDLSLDVLRLLGHGEARVRLAVSHSEAEVSTESRVKIFELQLSGQLRENPHSFVHISLLVRTIAGLTNPQDMTQQSEILCGYEIAAVAVCQVMEYLLQVLVDACCEDHNLVFHTRIRVVMVS